MKYTVNWQATKDEYWHHTASTMYEADGFRIWKGRICVRTCIYTSDEWHLERLSDHKILHSGKTAKECKGALEYCIKHGKDIYAMENSGLGYDIVFNEDFTNYEYVCLIKLAKKGKK